MKRFLQGLLAFLVIASTVIPASIQTQDAQASTTVTFGGASNDPLLDKQSTNLTNAVEMSAIMNGTVADVWYRDLTGAGNVIKHGNSSDALLKQVGNISTVLTGYYFPYVISVNGTYYMFAENTTSGNYYMWSSTDRATWSAMNSGNPVMTTGSLVFLANIGVAVVGSTWHMLYEYTTDGGSSFKMGYSSSNLSALNWDTNKNAVGSPVIANGGNPQLIYVADRNALLALHGVLYGSWTVHATYCSLSDNPALSASWHAAPNFLISDAVHDADPSLVVAGGGFTHNIVIGFNYNQADEWNTYSDAANITAFYDAVTATSNTNVASTTIYSDDPNSIYGHGGTYGNLIYVDAAKNYNTSVASGIFDFAMTGIPTNAVVTSATLKLYYYSHPFIDPVGRTLTVEQILRQDWVESQATWHVYKTATNWTTSGALGTNTDVSPLNVATATIPASYQDINVNVTNQVQASVSAGQRYIAKTSDKTNSATDYVVRVASRDYATATLRPRLEVTYEVPSADAIAVTTGAAYPILNPVSIYGTITSTNWSGNVTNYGFYVGTASGVWNYSGTVPITFTDTYGTYNNTSGTIGASLYNLAANTTYYYQAYAGGYDSGGVYHVYYGSVMTFHSGATSTAGTFSSSTGNLTQIVNPTTNLPALILSGSYVSGNYSTTGWGFLVGPTSASVANISVATIQVSHSGNGTGVPYQDFYDITTGTAAIYVRAYAINSIGIIVYGDIVTITPTLAADPVITLLSPSVIGNMVTLFAGISPPMPISQYAFSYGTHANGDNWQTYTVNNNNAVLYGLTTPILTLQPSVTLYYNAKVYTDHWVNSTTNGTFTTGASNNATVGAPTVFYTFPTWNVTDTGFVTTVNIDGANLTTVGVEYKLPSAGYWTTSSTLNATVAGSYNVTITGLTANTTYVYRGFALNAFGQKGVDSLTHNMSTILPTVNVQPFVTTGAAFSITDVSFKSSVVVAMGTNLTAVGMEYRLVNQTAWSNAGNISINDTGTYELTVSGLASNTSYYFRGYAVGLSRVTDNLASLVKTLAAGQTSPAPFDPHTGVTSFRDQMKSWMAGWGMDNDMGHWSFMGIIMAIFSIPAVIGALYIYVVKKDKFLANAVVVIAIILDVITLGTFLFSGLLGMWAVFALVFAVVALIFFLVAPIINGSKASSNG